MKLIEVNKNGTATFLLNDGREINSFEKRKMRNIKLTESDCTFVHYVLRMYAQQTPGLDSEEKSEIREVAAKFK